ncbi:MAG: MerR family transcriptional regulator [Actinobacteria bacterium]|nr:MerR family transcriptional regulator [Actinomycetota bacterium]
MERSTVGEIARLTGVSVRTLHHYDDIGLLSPAGRSDAGYRWYGPAEVARLQEVLFFKELGFSLDEIKRIVAEPGYDRATALRRQRRMLEGKAEHLLALIDAVDAATHAHEKGTTMSNEDLLGVFGGFDPAEYEEEAEERWGGTDAYRESARRTARYAKSDWERMGRERAEIEAAAADLLDRGVPPDGAEAMDVAERHRAHITAWFYDCTPEIHRGLGEMYVADPRFRAHYEQVREGLAEYLAAAIAANAAR